MSKSQRASESATPSSPSPGHPIAVVSERTGLSRDVLRVWERRYGVVEPERSTGGQRLYTDQQVERFRLLAIATRHGRNISLVASLSNEQLAQLIAEDDAATKRHGSPETGVHHSHVDMLLAYTLAYDGPRIESALRRAIAEFGLLRVLDVIVPHFMHRIGEEWVDDQLTIAHEHLASGAVMSVVLDAIRTVPERPDAPRILIATPAGEQHGIGAALVAATAALDGWTVVHLGVNVPAREISAAAEAVNARVVALSSVFVSDPTLLAREVTIIRDALASNVSLMVGGAAAAVHSSVLGAAGATVCASLHVLRSELSSRMAS